MAKKETVEKRTIQYQLTKYLVDFIFHRYLRTEVVGLEKLDPNKSYIFTPNHQGALMDALAILGMKRHWQPVFLARADIFKNPRIAKILYFLKILPIFRIRDGYKNLQENDAIFHKTLDVLRNRNGLVLLPEGNHGEYKNLRPLKKGVARIAFQAQEVLGDAVEIEIVPVGLDYSDYVKVRSRLLIRIGEPFSVKNEMELYKENNALAINSVMDKLRKRMQVEMINIDVSADYSAQMCLLRHFTPFYLKTEKVKYSHNQEVLISQKVIKALADMRNDSSLNAQYNEIILKLNEIDSNTKKYKLGEHFLPFKSNCWKTLPFNALVLLLTLPIFVYGYLNNLIEIGIPYLASLKIKDKQFISSVRCVGAMLTFPLFYLIQLIVFALVTHSFIWSLAYLLSLPLSLIAAYLWRKHAYRFAERCRLAHLLRTQPFVAESMSKSFDWIYGIISEKIKKN